MVRQEDAVLVLFRMREVVLRSSLSGNTLMMHYNNEKQEMEGCGW